MGQGRCGTGLPAVPPPSSARTNGRRPPAKFCPSWRSVALTRFHGGAAGVVPGAGPRPGLKGAAPLTGLSGSGGSGGSHGRDHPGDGRRRLHRQPLRAGAAAGGLRPGGHRQLPQRHPRLRGAPREPPAGAGDRAAAGAFPGTRHHGQGGAPGALQEAPFLGRDALCGAQGRRGVGAEASGILQSEPHRDHRAAGDHEGARCEEHRVQQLRHRLRGPPVPAPGREAPGGGLHQPLRQIQVLHRGDDPGSLQSREGLECRPPALLQPHRRPRVGDDRGGPSGHPQQPHALRGSGGSGTPGIPERLWERLQDRRWNGSQGLHPRCGSGQGPHRCSEEAQGELWLQDLQPGHRHRLLRAGDGPGHGESLREGDQVPDHGPAGGGRGLLLR